MYKLDSLGRGGALSAMLAVLVIVGPAACSMLPAKSGAPTSRCADLVAHAVTSYGSVKGSGHCVIWDDGSSPADSELANFTSEPPPVFDHIDRSCGYHSGDHTFTYLVSNRTDQAGGRVIVLVDAVGWVLDIAKHLDRKPGAPTHLACPSPNALYQFGGA